jgi:succinate-acetate transporter protein
MPKNDVTWANPGALGLAAFGLTTLLLQIHNIGLIANTMPLIWGFFGGGAAQVLAGIVDGRRGDTFGFTAFISYGVFWIGLAVAFFLESIDVITVDSSGLAWTMIAWGIFTSYMTIGAFKISRVHFLIFASLTVLFGLLAGHFYGIVPAKAAGIEGICVAAFAIYASAAVIAHSQYRRWIFPIGLRPAPEEDK